jgi:serine protease Do
VQGIGFAVAINTAKPVSDELLATGRVAYAYLGINYQWVNAATAQQLQLQGKQGVWVQRVEGGSPAARAGMQRGDVITHVNGQPLREEATLLKAVRTRRPGEVLELTVYRDRAERMVEVTLTARPG